MAAALPRVAPEDCNAGATPGIAGWLERMAARPAVAALAGHAPRR
jgi:hypothetical protein